MESEAYRDIFEHSLSGYALQEILFDETGNLRDLIFLEVNRAFESITGLRASEVVGRRLSETFPGIELRHLSLPPAPDEELPELARFQAMREFALFDEDWLLDFVPLDEQTEADEEERPRNVLAAAIGPELVKQIRKTCDEAGLMAERIVLRPCAAASLVERAEPAGDLPPRLLVDLLADEVDLTVVAGRKVVFLRTTRIGSSLTIRRLRSSIFASLHHGRLGVLCLVQPRCQATAAPMLQHGTILRTGSMLWRPGATSRT